MKLYLYWKDVEGNSYNIGILSKENNEYEFILNKEEYNNALINGCSGIGNLGTENQKSEKLFQFFKERIPGKDSPRLNKVLEIYKMKNYDEMELLKRSGAIVNTDRFFLQEN